MELEQATVETASQLTASTAQAVVETAAEVAALGLPLPLGLRAAAREAGSWRIAAGLKALAREIERGRSLDECLSETGVRLPEHVAGLIRAAQRTGDTGLTLAEWLTNRRAARQHWRGMIAALAYPTIIIVLAAALGFFFAVVVVLPFKQMYTEFGLKLPQPTIYLFRCCDFALRVVPGLAAAAVATAVGVRLIGGRAGWSWLVSNLPIVGKPWHWTGVVEMLRFLGLLVEHQLPLVESLRLTADGVADAYVARQCRLLASRVEAGRSLTMSLIDLRTLPLSIVPLVHWGERHNLLGEGLRTAADMIEGRLKQRTDVLAQIVPPLVFLCLGVTIASSVIALYMPMISLIQGLS